MFPLSWSKISFSVAANEMVRILFPKEARIRKSKAWETINWWILLMLERQQEHRKLSLPVWHYWISFKEDLPILLFQLQSFLLALVKILSTKDNTSRSWPNTNIFHFLPLRKTQQAPKFYIHLHKKTTTELPLLTHTSLNKSKTRKSEPKISPFSFWVWA